MTLKYASKWKLLVFAVFAAAKALQAVFIAYVFQEFINFAGNPKGSLLQLTIKAVVGIVLFACLALIYQIMQANIIKDVNLKIKEQATKYLLYSDNSDPKFDLSFMTNDLKQVESHRVEAELDIIFNGLQFIAAFAAAMLSSWALSLIFLVASLAPGLLQNVFGPKIEAASSAWEGENSKYTEAMTDTINFSAFARLYDAEDSIYLQQNAPLQPENGNGPGQDEKGGNGDDRSHHFLCLRLQHDHSFQPGDLLCDSRADHFGDLHDDLPAGQQLYQSYCRYLFFGQ